MSKLLTFEEQTDKGKENSFTTTPIASSLLQRVRRKSSPQHDQPRTSKLLAFEEQDDSETNTGFEIAPNSFFPCSKQSPGLSKTSWQNQSGFAAQSQHHLATFLAAFYMTSCVQKVQGRKCFQFLKALFWACKTITKMLPYWRIHWSCPSCMREPAQSNYVRKNLFQVHSRQTASFFL